jgi:hypothetical protein
MCGQPVRGSRMGTSPLVSVVEMPLDTRPRLRNLYLVTSNVVVLPSKRHTAFYDLYEQKRPLIFSQHAFCRVGAPLILPPSVSGNGPDHGSQIWLISPGARRPALRRPPPWTVGGRRQAVIARLVAADRAERCV